MPIPSIRLALTATAALAVSVAPPIGAAHAMQQGEATSTLTWTDIADLSDAAKMVVRVKIKKQAELKPERAPGLAPGYTRLYIEAETLALIAGSAPVGESLRYLVDVPLTAKGKAPKLKKSEFVLFARPVPTRPGEIQLVSPNAQLPWTPMLEQRLRPVLAQLAAPSAPPVVVGIRDALSVAGNLSGESETQIFLATANGAPVALSVVRRPGSPPAWGVSYSEIVDQAVRAPQPQTLNWYRLACFLPRELPGSAHLSQDRADRARADNDYRYVLEQLGTCNRTRMPPPAA
ncbi:hypothetical protein ACXYL9_02460 [Qipengyuania sp. CAU 1752]